MVRANFENTNSVDLYQWAVSNYCDGDLTPLGLEVPDFSKNVNEIKHKRIWAICRSLLMDIDRYLLTSFLLLSKNRKDINLGRRIALLNSHFGDIDGRDGPDVRALVAGGRRLSAHLRRTPWGGRGSSIR